MVSYTEDDVVDAIFDVTDNGVSIRQSAQKHGVPRSTLSARMAGRQAKKEAQDPQRLTPDQEKKLVDWIVMQECFGFAPSHSTVRAIAQHYSEINGQDYPIGKNWTKGFIRRNNGIATKVGRRVEAKRFDSFTPKAVHWYFDVRENKYGDIPPELTFNVDEGGIMAGFGLDGLVVGSSETKKSFLKSPQNRSWTSFIECISAAGKALEPGIIFKGKDLQTQWFQEEFKKTIGWYFITSEKGWTDNKIAVSWLKEVFIKQLNEIRIDPTRKSLLILDGHKSHTTDEFMKTCCLNNILLCFLPAHTSHGLQPLDNGPFNAVKAYYRKHLALLSKLTDSAPVDKLNFIICYDKARKQGLSVKNVLAGFRTTGNWPINRVKALTHPEIQEDKEKLQNKRITALAADELDNHFQSPTVVQKVRNLAATRSPGTRAALRSVSRAFTDVKSEIALRDQEILSLQAQLEAAKPKRRRKVPNPNAKFMMIAEMLLEDEQQVPRAHETILVGDSDEEDEENDDGDDGDEGSEEEENVGQNETILIPVRTRSGRTIRAPNRFTS